MKRTFGLSELFLIFKKCWIKMVIVSAVVAALSYCLGHFCVKKQYTSFISVYISSKGEINYSAELMSKEVSRSAVVLLSLSDDYLSDYLLSDGYINSVNKDDEYIPTENINTTPFYDLEKKTYSKERIKGMLNFSVVSDTGVIRITVTSDDKNISNEIAEALKNTIPLYLQETIHGIKVVPLSDARAENALKLSSTLFLIIIFSVVFICTYLWFAIKYISDETIKQESVFKASFLVPLFASVPRIFSSNKKSDEVLKCFDSDIKTFSAFNEKIRMIRTSIIYTLSKRNDNTFALSCSCEKENKSLISSNLAISFSSLNKKTLLIDADLRKPSVAKCFGLDEKLGLCDFLNNKCEFSDIIKKDVVCNLDVITSGGVPHNPSEILSCEKFNEFIQEVKEQYDYVIIDTAPINVVTDSSLVINKTSGVVLVARYGKTTYSELNKSIENINMYDGSVLGVVINDVKDLKYSL